jgi:hypothetical protein
MVLVVKSLFLDYLNVANMLRILASDASIAPSLHSGSFICIHTIEASPTTPTPAWWKFFPTIKYHTLWLEKIYFCMFVNIQKCPGEGSNPSPGPLLVTLPHSCIHKMHQHMLTQPTVESTVPPKGDICWSGEV